MEGEIVMSLREAAQAVRDAATIFEEPKYALVPRALLIALDAALAKSDPVAIESEWLTKAIDLAFDAGHKYYEEGLAFAVCKRELESHLRLALTAKRDTTQEPVAWGFPNTAITGKRSALMMVRLDVPSDDQYGGALWIPLYTAPPQRELTDEEITEVLLREIGDDRALVASMLDLSTNGIDAHITHPTALRALRAVLAASKEAK